MDDATTDAVRERAVGACEYCRLTDEYHPGPFEVEHVIPVQHGGTDAAGNLAYACLRCNRHKGPNIAGSTGERRGPGSFGCSTRAATTGGITSVGTARGWSAGRRSAA